MKTVIIAILAFSIEAQAGTLSFDEALTQILGRSTAVASARESLSQIEASDLPNRFVFVPSLTLDAKQTDYHGYQNTITAVGTTGVLRAFEVNTDLNLFHFGYDYFNLKGSLADEASSRANLTSTVLTTEQTAVTAIFTEIQNLRDIEVLKRVADAQREALRIAQARYDRGILALQEVQMVQVDLQNSISRLNDAQIAEVNSKANLGALLGDDSAVSPEWPWQVALEKPSAREFSEAPFSYEQQPYFQAARLKSEAEERRKQRNFAQLLPSLDATFSAGTYGTTNAGASLTNYQPGWVGAFTVTWPLFDHLVTYSSYRSQIYTAELADTQAEQARRQSVSDFETSKGSYLTALSSALGREENLKVSRSLYQDNLKRFQAGKIDANELLLDQNRLSDSETFAIQGWANVHLAFAALCHAHGEELSECLRSLK